MSHKRRTPCCAIEAHRFLDNIEGDHDTIAADLALADAVRAYAAQTEMLSWPIDPTSDAHKSVMKVITAALEDKPMTKKEKAMQIGDRVKHRINGFSGIITGSTEYINGCRQHLVAPEVLDKDGKVMDGQWTDEQNLTVVKAGVMDNPFAANRTPVAGGPEGPHRQR